MLTPRLNNVLVAHNQRKRLLSENEVIKMMLDLSLNFSGGLFCGRRTHKKTETLIPNQQIAGKTKWLTRT